MAPAMNQFIDPLRGNEFDQDGQLSLSISSKDSAVFDPFGKGSISSSRVGG